ENLALCLSDLDRTDEAIDVCRRAVALAPNSVSILLNLGVTHQRRNDFDAAAAEYRRVIAIDPNHAVAHYNLAIASASLGRFDEALALSQRAFELDPRNPAIRWVYWEYLLMSGDLANGFRMEYERQSVAIPSVRGRTPLPRWSGEPLQGRTLLVYT